MTEDRLIHLIAGVIVFFIFIKLSKLNINKKAMIYGFVAMSLGTWVSDWDLFLGIGFHRSPITHSALPALLFGWLILKYKLPKMLIIGFSIGLASHMLWDIIAYGNVQWISGGNNDRLFLFVNFIILIAASLFIKNKFLTSSSSGTTKTQVAP